MAIILEIATTDYDNDIFQIKKALSHLQTICEVTNGYSLSKPKSKFGWTFIQLLLKSGFADSIEKKFFDMIQKYGGKNEEKFTKFISDFFQARGCKIKLKLLDS